MKDRSRIRDVRRALAEVAKGLRLNGPLLKIAQRRYAASRQRARLAHEQKLRARDRSDRLRKAGHLRLADRASLAASRAKAKEVAEHGRAQHYLSSIKRHQRQIHKLEGRRDRLRAELKELVGVKIVGNRAVGGTDEERFKAVVIESVMNCSDATRRNFYSMSGRWEIDHVIVPGPPWDARDDCSSTLEAWCKAAGLPDPSGLHFSGGFTGTLVRPKNGWKQVSRQRMLKHGWGYVVYGRGDGHHVEAYIGPGLRTGGHGSAPVDFGVVDLFGPNEYQRYFIYDPD